MNAIFRVAVRWRLAAASAALAILPASIPLAMAAENASHRPDFSGQWGRDMLFYEPPASGAGPVRNLVRKADGTKDETAPCCAIVTAGGWAGDDGNPILKPAAKDAVRHFRELSDHGEVAQDLHNSCWPEPPPYVMSLHFGVDIVQTDSEVTFIYLLRNTVRHVRLNASHPSEVPPTWQGDSVGHYEGDTLVIDTVGVKTAPFSTVDPFGTPHSEALHVVERYRLIDGNAAAEAQKENGAINRMAPPYGRGIIDEDTGKKGLEAAFTVEDANVFTMPWSGKVTYRRLIGEWPEALCAENPHFIGGEAQVPEARFPDF